MLSPDFTNHPCPDFARQHLFQPRSQGLSLPAPRGGGGGGGGGGGERDPGNEVAFILDLLILEHK